MMSNRLRPIPADFIEFAPGKTVNALEARYRSGRKAILRWLNESGIEALKIILPPPPADFESRAKVTSSVDLSREYGVALSTISRWRKITGCPAPLVAARERAKQFERQPAPKVRKHINYGPKAAPITTPDSLADRAARHLMRFYKPVCRARIINPKADKDLWIVGRNKMTSGDMIDLAEDKGFVARWAA